MGVYACILYLFRILTYTYSNILSRQIGGGIFDDCQKNVCLLFSK